MNSILLAYSTVDGHTRLICSKLADLLRSRGCQVKLSAVDAVSKDELVRHQTYVIGASIRYGNYRDDLRQFINSHAAILNSKPSAFFSVNLVARKSGRDRPETNPYIEKLFSGNPWRPNEIAVFAGKLDYARYRFLDKQIIRLIMWLTNGPVNLDTCHDYTNWEKVAEFAGQIAELVRA